MKILIVDDSAVNLKLLRAVLESENFDVVEARDGMQALAALQGGGVGAIISDILMPHMDGYRLCQEVRKSRQWGATPFVFYTATYVSAADEKLCYDLGGDRYLRKPASRPALLAALREAVNSTGTGKPPRALLPSEADVMKEYSERLVNKLEEKIQELEQARAELQEANRELDARVRQRTAELEAANQELEAFSYSVSHDLRAPLNHINGYIDIVVRNCGGQLDETNAKYLQNVRQAAVKMGDLINALLELSKVTRVGVRRCPVDLSALAADVIAELRQSDPARTVKVEIAPALKANGDRRLLRIVLVNLLGNAWKYTRKRDGARIEFGRQDEGKQTAYFVRDNGVGFEMEYVGKLFGAFQRLHAGSEFEGAGIGLATVRRIIHRHNGKIRAEGACDCGATFYFTLGDGISD